VSRVIGGRLRGRRIHAPKGLATRPSAARVRQTLFDILAPRMPGCHFLDLYAGSGGIGLEALSRGAAGVVFVDSRGEAVATIRKNLQRLDAAGQAQLFRQHARLAVAALAESGRRFDIVYLDPPYDSDYEGILGRLTEVRILGAGGVMVVEHFHKRIVPETIGSLVRFRSVRVGDHGLSFYRQREGAGGEDTGVSPTGHLGKGD